MDIQDKANNKPLIIVFCTIFIDMLGIGVLIPIFPLLVLPYSAFRITPDSWSIISGFILLGWLSAAFPIAQFFSAPIFGQISDRFGRKPVLMISIVCTALSYVLFAIGIITKNIPLMFISRVIAGITGGNISVAQAIIADTSTEKNRTKNFGLIGMAFGLGFISGPFIGGKLADPALVSWFNAATPFYFTAILSIINVLLVITLLPETLKVKSSRRINVTKPLHNIALAFSKPGLRNIMPSTFFFNAGFTFFTTFFAITLAHKYGFTQGSIGNYFAYVGIMIVLAQGLIVRKAANYLKDYQALRFSMFGTATCLLVYYFIPASHTYLVYWIPPFMAAFNALTMSFNASLVTRVTAVNMRGEALGINSSVMAIAQVFPAILSGYVASIESSLPIMVGSLTVYIGGILFWLLFNPRTHTPQIAK